MENDVWVDDVVLQSLSLAELAADCAANPDEYSIASDAPPGETASYVEIGHISGQNYTFTGIRAIGFLRRFRAGLAFTMGLASL